MILYTKYSTSRNPAFAIVTAQLDDGGLFIKKMPENPSALAHVLSINDKYNSLSKLFEGSVFVANKCRIEDGAAILEYLDGESLETNLDKLLGNENELINLFADYANKLRELAKNEFEISDAYRNVFGNIAFEKNYMSMDVSDIDLIPSNIIVGDKWSVIDYEWTFSFPVPVDYIIWRALNYYINTNSKRSFLAQSEIYDECKLEPSDIKKFEKMEYGFQRYVSGGMTPTREIIHELSPGAIPVNSILEERRKKSDRPVGKIYIDSGAGFSEDDTMIPYYTGESYQIEADTGNAKYLRIDPTEEACLVTFINSSLPLKKAKCNGAFIAEDKIVFSTRDPQIIFSVKTDASFRAEYQVITDKETVREAIDEGFEQMLTKKNAKLSDKGKAAITKAIGEFGKK